MHMRSFLAATLALAGFTGSAALAACSRSEPTRAPDSTASAAAVTGAAIVAAGQPLVIHTTNNAVNLGLANDTVYMALSDSMLKSAREHMEADSGDESGGFAGRLSTVIKRGVSHALATHITYPVSDLNGARYEDGTIKFDYRKRHAMSFENVSINHNGDALSNFAPADAQRFVAAVNAAIHTAHPAQ